MKKAILSVLISVILISSLMPLTICAASDFVIYEESFSDKIDLTFSEYPSFTAYTHTYAIGRLISFNIEPVQDNGCITFTNPAGKAGYLSLDNSGALAKGVYIFTADVNVIELGGESANLCYLRDEATKLNFPGFIIKNNGHLYDICAPDDEVYGEDMVAVSKDGFTTLAAKYDFKSGAYSLFVNGRSVKNGTMSEEQLNAFNDGSAKPAFRLIDNSSDYKAVDSVSFKNAKVYKTDNPYLFTSDGILLAGGEPFTGTIDGINYENGVEAPNETLPPETSAPSTEPPATDVNTETSAPASSDTLKQPETSGTSVTEPGSAVEKGMSPIIPIISAAAAAVITAVVVTLILKKKKSSK